jgi:hypothetical protein
MVLHEELELVAVGEQLRVRHLLCQVAPQPKLPELATGRQPAQPALELPRQPLPAKVFLSSARPWV